MENNISTSSFSYSCFSSYSSSSFLVLLSPPLCPTSISLPLRRSAYILLFLLLLLLFVIFCILHYLIRIFLLCILLLFFFNLLFRLLGIVHMRETDWTQRKLAQQNFKLCQSNDQLTFRNINNTIRFVQCNLALCI